MVTAKGKLPLCVDSFIFSQTLQRVNTIVEKCHCVTGPGGANHGARGCMAAGFSPESGVSDFCWELSHPF